MKSVFEKITAYNQNRNVHFVHLKYKAISENPHRFFRGTNHLFMEYLAKESVFKKVPFSYVCGDMHLENFGSYKGNSGLVYFDINDFDESAVAPCTTDLVKLCVSVFLVAQELNLSEEEALSICKTFIDSYGEAILSGHASRLENVTAKGLVKDFFKKVEERDSNKFLKSRIYSQHKQYFVKTDFRRYYPLASSQKKMLEKSFYSWVEENKHKKDQYTFLDAAFRIAGTGSLGLNRYVVLVKDHEKNNYVLFDIKQAERNTLEKMFVKKQLSHKSEAHRLVHIQKRMNDTAPAGFTTILLEKEYYMLKKLRPQEDKFSLLTFKEHKSDFRKLLSQLGYLLAWAQLRSSGVDGTATADELMGFVKSKKISAIIPAARRLTRLVLSDYAAYLKDYEPKKGKVIK